ncbi:dnaJ homolog subfamily C member 16-like [Pecten maximus]|uniref:dnaJ homolog subfamily C member 16-like n=1 Tax=Pecten maximus TaxID=6579 RepID=UPI001458CA9B|nr:dnaJ homolog subfamily C member 16-like [Pecten maximus]
MLKLSLFLLLILIVTISTGNEDDDLYRILGVKRTASLKEIKQAYKAQAREWHPDKNKDPDAADVFTKINEAYETLSDEEKRRQYDRFGYTTAREPQRQHGFHQGGGPFEGFGNFFRSSGFHFGGGESIIDKYTVTYRMYETKILPESYSRPYFLYAYADFCFECSRIDHHIEKFIKELDLVGIGVGTFHAGHAGGLASELRVHHVPAILGIVNGRSTFFTGSVGPQQFRDFIRKLFPAKLIDRKLTDDTYSAFLDGWMDNQMRAIILGQKEEPAIRFLATAMHYKNFVKFAYINTASPDIGKIMKKNGVNKHRETLLMFNEESSSPVATISMHQLSRSTLNEVIESNKFLLLPRLSSQEKFEELCPIERSARRKKLCVVLLTKKAKDNEKYRESFRQYIRRSPFLQQDRVRFTYIYEDTQKDFVKSLTKGSKSVIQKNAAKVVLIWRMDIHHLSYDWLKSGWSGDPQRLQECEEYLEEKVKLLLNSDQSLAYKILLPEFHNEHALGLMVRIVYRLLDWADRVFSYLTSYDGFTVGTVLLSLFLMFFMGYFMNKMAAIEHEQVMEKKPKNVKSRPPSTSVDNKKVNLYEINYKSYDDLIVHVETGLTFALLVDEESKERLLNRFGELVFPNYTRYSALTFGFIDLDLYLGWYRHLLEECVDYKQDLSNIKIKSCIGTVLAINGFRNYYYIYHPKRVRKWVRKHTDNIPSSIGFFDTDEESDSEEKRLRGEEPKVEDLLKGYITWMDRVFDGSVKKIRVPYWPEMVIS